jgi:murein DD-endopeptidase MepM/ murein hydrolase activator NlpD
MEKIKIIKHISLLLCILCYFSVSAPQRVSAATQDDLNSLLEDIQNNKDAAEAQQEIATILTNEMQQIDEEIAAIQAQIDDYNTQKTDAEARLAAAQAELEQATADRVNYQKMLDERISVMYMYGDMGYLDVLFGANSFSDFIGRLYTVKSIMAYDNQIAQKLKETEATIEAKKTEIETEYNNINTILENLQVQEQNLQTKYDEKEAAIATAQSNAVYYAALAEQQEKDALAIRRELAQQNSTGEYSNDFSYLIWPTPGYYTITDSFGYRWHPITGEWRMHYGTDIGASYGTPIIAPGNGKVILSQYYGSYGYCVVLDLGTDEYGNQWRMLFAHASRLVVSVGDIVVQGDTLAYVGSTGASTGPHLHVEVIINGVNKDPMDYLVK